MHLPKSLARRAPSANDGDFVTGSCITCDSTVRWPRQLDVFRCTVCLTVNDLKPLVGSAKPNGPAASPRDATHPDPGEAATPFTLDKTRSLADECIRAYLKERVSHHKQLKARREKGEEAKEEKPPRHTQWVSNNENNIPPTLFPRSSEDRVIPRRPMGPHAVENRIPRGAAPSINTNHEPSRHPQALSPTGEVNGHRETASEPGSVAAKAIFKQLEKYILDGLSDCSSLSKSFWGIRVHQPTPSGEESVAVPVRPKPASSHDLATDGLFEVDHKTLMLGDIGENGTWWTGNRRSSRKQGSKDMRGASVNERKAFVFDWYAIHQWYDCIFGCGKGWRNHRQIFSRKDREILEEAEEDRAIELSISEGRYHLQRTFLKAVENMLRRPGRPLKTSEDARFLIILLVNPLLYPHSGHSAQAAKSKMQHGPKEEVENFSRRGERPAGRGGANGQHSGIIKRLLGLISNLPNDVHSNLVYCFSRLPEGQFRDIVELVGGFVTYRLGRRHESQHLNRENDPVADLIPNMAGPGAGTSAHLHAAIGSNSKAPPKETGKKVVAYENDWQIRAAAKVMSVLFSANTHGKHLRQEVGKGPADLIQSQYAIARLRAHRHSQILPTSEFYNTLLDYADLISDFERWEARGGKFSFCQYPMFLSIWAKIQIMEHDARRQMEIKARDAFFTNIMSKNKVNQYLKLKVRRDCLVDDSLRSVSEVVGSGQEEIKKALRIDFVGEEGVDAGGLRKEWFALLVREVFDPNHGLFIYDEESQFCYFNPNSFETSDQFFLVGVVLGLAIYNSTILDVALPPFAFRKLLAAAPNYSGPSTTAVRPTATYTLEDLAEWRPSLANGLRQLLEHKGDVAETFCRDFVIDVERYGQMTQVPLCPNGDKRPVTNSNRHEFVDLYIRYLLDTAVSRQFEPFKRGFFTVCGGNALSLFRPEEIELLVRGSDEPLDVASLRAVAIYENWPQQSSSGSSHQARERKANAGEPEVAAWFWDSLEAAETRAQRELLAFVTGSDRIPAMGATSLVIKIVCLSDDRRRYPVARTCFNVLGLHAYRSRPELEQKLWRAVSDSEGFGLK